MNINHNLISENDNNIYYTLIFSPNLIKTKSRRKNKDKIVKGYKLTQQTNLPNDPRMLYGTNDNDVAKFTIIDRYMEWTFNFISKKESVKFWEETKVYTLPRDIRIIMWQGGEELNLSKDKCAKSFAFSSSFFEVNPAKSVCKKILKANLITFASSPENKAF